MEIKVRAVSKRDIELGTPLMFHQEVIDGKPYFVHEDIRYPYSGVMFDDDFIKMLSTTLHDRHGKEIWEGDKVRFLRKQGYWSHDKGDIEEVKYITDPQAQYCGFGFSALHPLTSRKAKKIDVIGNIFEGEKK